ncbi:MAG: ATP-grasp domain-containing protein, partial [Deltaproteobacteria bacterium]|nr:ATP-grasp domain-containing protein [Deltaproteobacteria bacterium]
LRVSTLEDVRAADFPAFVKPLVPKQFRGSVYETLAALSQETEGLAPDTAVFVSDVVSLEAEARAFVLDGRVLDCAVYEGLGDPSEAASFVRAVLAAVELPRTCVVDVGRLPGGEWAVVEFNATWGSGLNGCNATHVIEAIAAASEPDS